MVSPMILALAILVVILAYLMALTLCKAAKRADEMMEVLMRKLVLVIVLVLLPTVCYAGPFLTCDCTPAADEVTGFQLQFGAATPVDVATFATCGSEPACATGQFRICYDMAAVPAGAYSVKALAKNSWGVSNWTAPLSGTKALPTSPSLLKIVP